MKLAYLIRWRHFLVTECSLKHYRHHISEARPIIEPNHQNVLLNDIDFVGKRTLKTWKLPKNNISDSKADENSNWLSFYEIILNWYFEFFHRSSWMLLSNHFQSMIRLWNSDNKTDCNNRTNLLQKRSFSQVVRDEKMMTHSYCDSITVSTLWMQHFIIIVNISLFHDI